LAIMKNKPVSFNIENQMDKALLDYANTKSNFSGYIKKLMQEDMKRRAPVVTQNEQGGIKISIK
jgi:hypothetical protein